MPMLSTVTDAKMSTSKWNCFVLHFGVGSFLICTSILKFSSDLNPASGLASLMPSDFLQSLVLFSEFVLGSLLITFRFPLASHLVSTGFFASFSAASFWMVMKGVSECGCFGGLSVSPWFSLVLDLFILGSLLVATRWLSHLPKANSKELWAILVPILSSVMLFVASLLALSIFFDCDLDSIRYRMFGAAVVASPSRVDIGEVEREMVKEFDLVFRNYSQSEAKIVGYTNSCNTGVRNGCDRLIRAQLVFATICLHNI